MNVHAQLAKASIELEQIRDIGDELIVAEDRGRTIFCGENPSQGWFVVSKGSPRLHFGWNEQGEWIPCNGLGCKFELAAPVDIASLVAETARRFKNGERGFWTAEAAV